MKQQSIYIILLFVTSLLGGCTDLDKGNPYEDQLHTLQVTAVYPDDYAEYLREGITVQIEDIARGNSYKTVTDQNGTAQFALTNGIYRIQISDKADQHIFNGLADKVKLVNGDITLNVPLTHSKAGAIIIKESIAEDVPSCRRKVLIRLINTLSCTTMIPRRSISTICV